MNATPSDATGDEAPGISFGDILPGEIRLFSAGFYPTGWLACNGAELPIATYPMLYQAIGNQFGGTPGSTFRIPNLQGLVVMGADATYPVGQQVGSANVALSVQHVPPHQHLVTCSAGDGTTNEPGGGVPAAVAEGKVNPYATLDQEPTPMVPVDQNPTQALSHPNEQPYLALTFMIFSMNTVPNTEVEGAAPDAA